MKKILVIGCGYFGRNLSLSLAKRGAEVVAVDIDMAIVNELKDQVAYAVKLNATDEKSLASLGIPDIDVGIACIGESFECNLLAAVNLKNLGIKRVIARAATPVQFKIMRAVGVDQVISPEQDAAEYMASSLMNLDLMDAVPIGDGYTAAKIPAPTRFYGKTLAEIGLRPKFGVNLISIFRQDPKGKSEGKVIGNPDGDTTIMEGDELGVVALERDLKKLTSY